MTQSQTQISNKAKDNDVRNIDQKWVNEEFYVGLMN